MIETIRYYSLPQPILNEQRINPLTRGLYLCETGEIYVPPGEACNFYENRGDCLLIYCTRGTGRLSVLKETILIHEGQYYIVPSGKSSEFRSGSQKKSRLLFAWFNGENIGFLEKEFSVVRAVIPSVRNQVANREMLFDEIFNNLAKGFHDENLIYISLCFAHLLATFVYGHTTIEDEEGEPAHVVRKAVLFFEQNLHNRLTLGQVAREVGYSPTYFTTIFRKETGYAPLSYFSHLKIVRACEYLDQTSAKVKQVSFSLGYSDPYYFARDFKKKMGMSPRQYRNRISSRLIKNARG